MERKAMIATTAVLVVLQIGCIAGQSRDPSSVCYSCGDRHVYPLETRSHRLHRSEAQKPPKLEKQTSSETKKIVKNGKTASLKCPVQQSLDSEIFFEWSKNGIPIEGYDKRIKITDSGVLRIKNTVPEDSGRFNCKAINGFGSVESSVSLIVLDENYDEIVPDQDLSDPNQLTRAHEFDGLTKSETDLSSIPKSSEQILIKKTGSNVRFKCGVSSTPKTSIIWFHNDQQLSESEPRNGRNSLVINDLKPEDSGNYTCLASNQFGSVTQTYIIKVIDDIVSKPLMEANDSGNTTVNKGEQTILHCSIKSEERPRVQWLKKMDVSFDEADYELSESSHYIKVMGELYKSLDSSQSQTIQVSENLYSNSFVIEITNELDSGKYLCMATNKMGSSFKTAFLTVVLPVPKRMEPMVRVDAFPVPIAVALVSVLFIVLMALIVWLSLCCTRKAEPVSRTTLAYSEKPRPTRPLADRPVDQNYYKVANVAIGAAPDPRSNSPFYSELVSTNSRLSNVYQLYSNADQMKSPQNHGNKCQTYLC